MDIAKPRLKVIAGRPVVVGSAESPITRARRRYGRPFAHERGNAHEHSTGPTYWTPERVAQIAESNRQYRRQKERGIA